MDKMSTYHSAIPENAWLVVILTINQTIATLYCAKVTVTIFGNHHKPIAPKEDAYDNGTMGT